MGSPRRRNLNLGPSSWWAVIITIPYILVGVVFYTTVEEKPCESRERIEAPEYNEDTCMEGWTWVDSLYFSVVTMSTVGYGDFKPSSGYSRVFTVFYIFVGLFVISVLVASSLSRLFTTIEAHFVDFIDEVFKTKTRSGNRRMDIAGGNGAYAVAAPPPSWVYWGEGAASGFFVLASWTLFAAAFFCWVEPTLSYGEALYHCLVTATTVGYGDVVLHKQGARLWAVFHTALNIVWLVAFVTRMDELRRLRKAQLQREALLMCELDEDPLRTLDKGGQGVDKFEFVIGMLSNMGAEMADSRLLWEELKPFIELFDKCPKSADGKLTKNDAAQIKKMRVRQVQRIRMLRHKSAATSRRDPRIRPDSPEADAALRAAARADDQGQGASVDPSGFRPVSDSAGPPPTPKTPKVRFRAEAGKGGQALDPGPLRPASGHGDVEVLLGGLSEPEPTKVGSIVNSAGQAEMSVARTPSYAERHE